MPNESLSPSADDSGLPREAYTLLAQANLLRMRGCWEEAVQNCMTALRLAPDSSSAQSLLGDIYENQGRFDDAIQWYRMALDANPDSPADKIKLDRLLSRQSPLSVSHNLAVDNLIIHKSDSSARLHLLREHPETTLRYASLAAALIVIVIVIFAYAAVHHQAALSSLGLSNQDLQTKPVVVPPAVSLPTAVTAPVTWRDTSEQALLDTLLASSQLSSQGITVTDIRTDPRTQQITVALALSPTAPLTRSAILHSSLHTIEAIAALSPSTGSFSARCLVLPKSGTTVGGATLLFVGDVSQSTLPSTTAPEPSDEQIQTIFSNVWWSPQIAG